MKRAKVVAIASIVTAGLTIALGSIGPALGEVEAALETVNSFRDRPAGTLRLNVPVSAARSASSLRC